MTFIPDDQEAEQTGIELQRDILKELKKISYLLAMVNEIELEDLGDLISEDN